jgi:predicted amidophosphoribosyltransferase
MDDLSVMVFLGKQRRICKECSSPRQYGDYFRCDGCGSEFCEHCVELINNERILCADCRKGVKNEEM